MNNIDLTQKDLETVFTPKYIREQSQRVFDLTLSHKTHFNYHADKFDPTVEYVKQVILEKYPDLKIPFHSRWGHFKVGGIDRTKILEEKISSYDLLQKARTKIDLAIVSVLLDAGAGSQWKYKEPISEKVFNRSEGLAVASYDLFMKGTFSHDPHHPYQVTALGLKNLTIDVLKNGFQVALDNPLVGIEGRLSLLKELGKVIEQNETYFKKTRPGHLVDYFSTLGKTINATDILSAILSGLGEIWPGRITIKGKNLGDVWQLLSLGDSQSFRSLIPFHKLSQWLTYSLIEPIEETGIKVLNLNEMTGLPEYRNGGLFLDSGLITLKDSSLYNVTHRPDSSLIVEWRALTIILLDKIAIALQKELHLSSEEFPLVKVLEGGTWWAGRKIAQEKRSDATPPLKIESDGTVF